MTVTSLLEEGLPMVRIEIPHSEGMVTVPCLVHNARSEACDRRIAGIMESTIETIRAKVDVTISENAIDTILGKIHEAQETAERYRNENGLDPLPDLQDE